jgi:sugar/nucleoside kinase (ribokinase family)
MGETERSRGSIARAAAEKAEAFGRGPAASARCLIGFDGFIDSIIHVVSRRHSMVLDDFERIETIPEFAARTGSAAGKSANIEMVVRERRFGGNGPLMAGALGRLGAGVTYIGAIGREADPTRVDPVFEPFVERCRGGAVSLAAPGLTDAMEFDDGKLMFGKPQNVQEVTWERIKATVGLDEIRRLLDGAALLGVVNWVMMGGVEGIWRGLMTEVLPAIEKSRRPRVFIDLCDPAKRTDEDVRRALAALRALNEVTPVTLGLNLAESQRIARVAGASPFDDSHNYSLGQAVRATTESIRQTLGLDTVVVHPRQGAAAADARGHSAWFEGPFTSSPALSTGAGDHFNGGFSFGQIAGMDLHECLAIGCGVSGTYVRDAQSPSLDRLVQFLRDMPAPD